MSSLPSHAVAKCDCCGADVAAGEGYIVNASLSEKFADKIVRSEEKRGTLSKLAPKLIELRLKQVLTCSEPCALRAVDSDEELAMARRAAEIWWQVRNPQAPLNSPEDVYITRGMLLRAGTETVGKAAQAGIEQAATGGVKSQSRAATSHCERLFVLGVQFRPGDEARELVAQYMREHPHFDFSGMQTHVDVLETWTDRDRAKLRLAVIPYLMLWFQGQKASFNSEQVAYTDYYDDATGRAYVLAAYVNATLPDEIGTASASQSPRSFTSQALPSGGPLGSSPAAGSSRAAAPTGSVVPIAPVETSVTARLKARQSPIQRALKGLSGKNGIALGAAAALVLLLIVVLAIPWGGSGKSDGAGGKTASNSNHSINRPDAAEVMLPKTLVGVCRVYTSEPGFTLLIDGVPVRNEQGEAVPTPCEVVAPKGTRVFTVTREGYADATKDVVVEGVVEVSFEVLKDEGVSSPRIVDAPYYTAKPGEPIPLDSVNSPGNEIDPYITPDGRAIWFAADRSEGKGIFYATRSSIYQPFEEPQILKITRGFDMPASPTVTGDGLSVVYVVPDGARIFSVTRPGPLADFEPKVLLRFSQRPEVPHWPSVQILADGLRLYWVEEAGKETPTTLTAIRDSIDDDFSIAKLLKVETPGLHPCMSGDGLRQYIFDGRTLRRAIREKVNVVFSNPQTIADVNLPNYRRSEKHRQFFVSDDERWLFYSDNPDESGDLYMVRIETGNPVRMAATAKPIPPKVIVADASTNTKKRMAEDEPLPDVRPVDPRSLPLPYTSHWDEFTAALAARSYDKAQQLVDKALADSRFQMDRELLNWDAEELKLLREFWVAVHDGIAALKPGDMVGIGGARVQFVSATKETIVGKTGTEQIERPLGELNADNLALLAEKKLERTNQQHQFRIAAFLYYDGTADPLSAESRLLRSGNGGKQFLERQGQRKLRQARQELARDKFSEAVALIDFVDVVAPNTPAANEAAQLRSTLYEYIKWEQRGPRQWSVRNGEFAAASGRTPNSVLISPRKYKNFELSMEWKTTAGDGAGGVIFRHSGSGPFDGATQQYKIYIANDYGVAPDPLSTGALFKIKAPSSNAVAPLGEWNAFKMRVTNDGVRLVVTINNKAVLQTTVPDPNIPFEGYVALDGAVGGITYRKVLISELPEGTQ